MRLLSPPYNSFVGQREYNGYPNILARVEHECRRNDPFALRVHCGGGGPNWLLFLSTKPCGSGLPNPSGNGNLHKIGIAGKNFHRISARCVSAPTIHLPTIIGRHR
jgi:hypothetical protein